MSANNKQDMYECAGDYCDFENMYVYDLPQVHQDLIFELRKKKEEERIYKNRGNNFFENLQKHNQKKKRTDENSLSLPINETYTYYIIQKTIVKDRRSTGKGKVTRNQLTLLFERVRVCPDCYSIYKDLEKYYFKDLKKLKRRAEKKELSVTKS